MKTKVQVEIEGQKREVEVDLTPQVLQSLGLMTKDEVGQGYMPKDAFEAELDRRVKSLTKGKFGLEDLDSNPELKKSVLDKLGVKVNAKGQAELTADQVSELERSWKERHAKPLEERAAKAEGRVKSLLDRTLESSIITAAAEFGVKERMLKPIAQGKPAPIVTMLRDVFGHSEEHDQFFVRKGESFDFSSDAKGTGSPYKGVREFVQEWARDKSNADFVNAQRPGGAGVGSPAGQGGVVEVTTPTDGTVLTLQDYKAAQERAGDGGRVVVKTAG